MRQRNLEIQLERVAGFNSPSTYLEQYSTPATLAAELVFFAFMRNDLVDPVYDLGCGTGIIAIAAALMGAEKVVGFDIDKSALYTAKKMLRVFILILTLYAVESKMSLARFILLL